MIDEGASRSLIGSLRSAYRVGDSLVENANWNKDGKPRARGGSSVRGTESGLPPWRPEDVILPPYDW